MKNLVIKKNNEIDDVLLDEILNFDRTIFSVDEEYSFPDNYFRKIYQNSKDGIFVLLNNNNNVIGYVNCIFLSDEGKEKYILDRDYLSLENIGFNIGHNNMYLYNLVLKKEYRDTHVIKLLMIEFSKWLYNGWCNGKKIKSCISEAVTQDGIKTLLSMGMIPKDVDDKGLGIYYSPDCLRSYVNKMIKN